MTTKNNLQIGQILMDAGIITAERSGKGLKRTEKIRQISLHNID